MPDHQADYELIIRFIEGNTNTTETADVLTWINSDKSHEELYFRIKDLVDYYTAQSTRVDTAGKWQEIISQAQTNTDAPVKHLPPRKKLYLPLLRYAAMLAIIAGLFLFYYYNHHSAPQQFVVQVPSTEQSRLIVLPDSSKVWVKGGGELRYEGDFLTQQRSVWLKGTGYFEVTKIKNDRHERLPFVVHTAKSTVTVLGTSFTVDDDQKNLSVIVSTGLVRTAVNNKLALLHPGERLRMEADSLVLDKVNPALYAAWKDGDYQFDKTSIEELRSVIETIYNYKVVIKPSAKLKAKRIGGRFTITNEDMLWRSLELLLRARIVKQNDQLIIQSN